MKTVKISLRSLIRCLLAVGLVSMGCSEKESSPPLTDAMDGSSQPKGELVVLTWEEYFDPEVIERFEQEHDLKVVFEYFDNLQEMKGLIESQPDRFDLIVADGSTLADLIELQALRPIDQGRLTNFGNLDSKYLDLEFDPGNQFTVPYMWGTTVIAYRSDQIPEPAQSWMSLWDRRYAGKVLMLDDPFDLFGISLLSQGFGVNSEDPSELETASKHLVTQTETVGADYLDIIEIRERLVSGEAWIAMAYSSDAAMLAEENENIAFFIPEEGSTLWLDSFGIPREAKNESQAHLFLNFLCRGDIAGMSSNFLWCATPNRAALEFLSPEVLAEKTVYPNADTLNRSEFLIQAGAERNRRVNQGMKLVYDSVAERHGRKVQSAQVVESDPNTPEPSEDHEKGAP